MSFELGPERPGRLDPEAIKHIIEGALFAAGRPLRLEELLGLFAEQPDACNRTAVHSALEALKGECAARGIELTEVASGYRFQVKPMYAPWINRLWMERPTRYSRALLETLALIAYRQPITRGEIEEIRGVGVSSSILKTLQEREWIRVHGHREVPGRPALYGTTRQFLDHFGLKSLDELPPLAPVQKLDNTAQEPAVDEAVPSPVDQTVE
jgi:segregation and condensation protein B